MESVKIELPVIQKLKSQRELCEKNIHEYEKKITETKNVIKREIKKNCVSHNWKTERESGMYGEKFTYCTICGSDYFL
jgi:hypothetical protein